MPMLTASQSRALQQKDPLLVTDPDLALAVLEREQVIAFDIETSGLSPWKDRVAVVSFNGLGSGATAVLHLRGALPRRLIDLFNDESKTFVGHNIMCFDLLFLALAGVDIHRATYYDTLLGEQVCSLTNRRDVRFSLKASAYRQLGVELKKDADHAGWMNPTLTDQQVEYCAGDVKFIHELRDAQLRKAKDKNFEAALDVEMSMVPVVAQMELNGMPIDLDRFWDHLRGEEERSQDALFRLYDLFGPQFNPGSAPQCLAALKTIGVDLHSTGKDVLTELINSGADEAGILRDVVACRGGRKSNNSYNQAWVDKFVAPDGCIHPRQWSCGTATGRFSSSDPNMQQWPRDMRWVVRAQPGKRLVFGDYQQLEVAVAAALAKDQRMLQAIASGEDIHTSVASQIFGVSASEVTEEPRRQAKAANFTFLFGGWYKTFYSRAKLAGSSITLDQAQSLEERYFSTYQGIAAMKDKAKYLSRRGGPVTMTLPTGLRRTLIPGERGSVASTQILNTAVQGTAAAGMKYALLDLYRKGIVHRGVGLTFHDEIAGQFLASEAEEVAKEMEESMVQGMKQAVDAPVGADMKVAEDWRKK